GGQVPRRALRPGRDRPGLAAGLPGRIPWLLRPCGGAAPRPGLARRAAPGARYPRGAAPHHGDCDAAGGHAQGERAMMWAAATAGESRRPTVDALDRPLDDADEYYRRLAQAYAQDGYGGDSKDGDARSRHPARPQTTAR